MNNDIVKKLHPKITGETLTSNTSAAPKDVIGSYDGNRKGVLRGSPSITWYSTDTKQEVKTVGTGSTSQLYINGYNMNMVSNIYIVANPVSMFNLNAKKLSYFQDNFPSGHRIKAENPSLTGASLSSWVVTNNNNIKIEIPSPRLSGDFEVVLQGPAGYSNVADDSNIILTVTGTETTGTTATTGTETTGTTATTGTETTGTTATTDTEDSLPGAYISDHLRDL